MNGRARQTGFTLLEAIVTLVIVSLLVTILMQALGQAMNLRTRLLRFEGESRQAALQEAWFRDTTAGMQREALEEEGQLGTREWLEYTTPAPLVATGFSTVRWWLDGGRLHYADARVADVVIIAGPLRNAGFSYLDENGDWTERWTWQDHGAKLPKMVRLSATTARGNIDWLVPLMADGLDPNTLKLDEFGNSDGI